MKHKFRTLAKWALVLVYLVIVAGAIVRMTGSGMGCPDWPKCFGYLIPPTTEKELLFMPNHNYQKGVMILDNKERFLVAKSDFISRDQLNPKNWEVYSVHDYVSYDPLHTWVEYINRLIGVAAGLPILLFFFVSFLLVKSNKWIPIVSTLTIFGMGFQAWLGKTVVDSNLAPFKITIHMVMALLIVGFILYLIFASKQTYKTQRYNPLFLRILCVSLIVTLIQIILGTQVRQFVDEQIKIMSYQKQLWLENPELNFYIHRSTSILVVVLNGSLWYLNKKHKLGFKKILYVVTIIALEVWTGILMYYFDFPLLSQPLHLVLASLLFGVQFYVLLEVLHKKNKIQA
jgi:cytochrome c oxidase assembly protein subunit 15